MTLDAKATAALVTDAATLESFLGDLFASLPASIDAAARTAAVEKLMAGMDTAAVEGEAAESVALAALVRRGKAAAWAAGIVAESKREKALAARKEKAVALCKAKGLTDADLADVFVDLVAESIDNSTRTEALIADRKARQPGVTNPAPAGGNPISPPPTPGAKKTAKELAAEYTR